MSKDGGPAFPQTGDAWNIDSQRYLSTTTEPGMTLRDYFAAKAMAVVAKQTAYNMKDNESHESYTARCAYAMADAMLAARAKP